MSNIYDTTATTVTFLAAGLVATIAGGICGAVLGLPNAFLYRAEDVTRLEVPTLIGFAAGIVVFLWFNEHAKPDADD